MCNYLYIIAMCKNKDDETMNECINDIVVTCYNSNVTFLIFFAVVRALDLRLEVAGSVPAAALSSATLDKLFTHIVQRLWSYDLMALYKSV